MTPSRLDLSRLEKVRHSSSKITARCPACAEGGGDRSGNHLCIFPTGKFACAATPGDIEHRRLIFALVGIPGEREQRDPAEVRQWLEQRAAALHHANERQSLLRTIRQKRASIISRHPWAEVDVWDDSPQRIDSNLVETDPRHFMASLFPPESLVWAGEVYHSGTRNAHHWRTVTAWQRAANVGPMTTPSVWKPNSENRSPSNVHHSPFTVLDFDGFDGVRPETPEEIEEHRQDSLALIRWIHTGLRWKLAAIVWTGSKSMHAWFHTPAAAVLNSLREASCALGIDAGLIGRPEHPCRLPGQRHEKTGEASRVLWLQKPQE